MTSNIFIFIAFCILYSLSISSSSMGCLDESGSPVDWWLVYKFPELEKSSNSIAQTGFGYAYMDSSTDLYVTNNALDQNVPSFSGALGSTLKSLYKNTSAVNYFLWNDETPEGKKVSSHAHSKGIVAFNSGGGYYILHSTPRFPIEQTGTLTFPVDEKDYGQHFLCVNLDSSALSTLGSQLQIVDPNIYDQGLGAGSVPTSISQLLKGYRDKTTGVSSVKYLAHSFFHLGKNEKWGKDFWEDLVCENYRVGFLCETWRRDPALPTYCKGSQFQYDAINVNNIQFDSEITWKYTKDHSKWGISESSSKVFCFADINRMSSQTHRGGGGLCMIDSNIWNQLNAIISEHDKC